MKFTSALALGMAHLALGKVVNNVYPPARRDTGLEVRDGHKSESGASSVQATQDQIKELERLLAVNPGSGIEINFLWVNVGGGAATTVINAASTVTVTATVNGTPPPAVATNVNAGGATNTVAAGATGTVAATGATHSVVVGGSQGLSFNPTEITAAIGDTVIFTFMSQNHTATQSAFAEPCKALAGGMDSGFQANVNNTVNPPPQVAMQVMVSTPLWFYCRQKGHCGKGMTFSINPTAAKTQAMFQAMAIAQNGTGTGGAITGNAGSSSAVAAPPAATSAAAGSAAAPSAVSSATGAAATGIVSGTGQVAAGGACICAVSCSFGSGFPAPAVQGRDAFGGFSGSLPQAMAITS
ncbi:hypothetical protein B0T22DRAFT_443644 [Podospora appendiculata]|uniref:Phytocyanin domain-containing protein n=1 Tax=Podospora appendiculata TaxID=314037 RepID=A0AAE1C921_9PEZI|nr:hypothetical protein B0T22DRAFT_443644 [Podospora appendiculata]